MNHIYRLVWNKKRNMLMAVAELASAQGNDAAGEADANGRPGAGRQAGPATPGARRLLAGAILAIFPLVSFAQIQQHTIAYGNVETWSDTDGTNAAAVGWRVINDGGLDISATVAGSAVQSLAGSGSVLLGSQTLSLLAAQDTFGGVRAGAGGWRGQAGFETLGGTQTYTGATSINPAGAVMLAGSGSDDELIY